MRNRNRRLDMRFPKPGRVPIDTKPGTNQAQQDIAIQRMLLSPSFPGGQQGATIESIREFIRSQPRILGQRLTGGLGTTEFDIQLSGSAVFFLGIQFNVFIDADCTLIVNNEIIYDSVPIAALTPTLNPRSYIDWFVINRPLSGTDKIKLIVQDALGVYDNVPFTSYYI